MFFNDINFYSNMYKLEGLWWLVWVSWGSFWSVKLAFGPWPLFLIVSLFLAAPSAAQPLTGLDREPRRYPTRPSLMGVNDRLSCSADQPGSMTLRHDSGHRGDDAASWCRCGSGRVWVCVCMYERVGCSIVLLFLHHLIRAHIDGLIDLLVPPSIQFCIYIESAKACPLWP